MMRHLWKSAAVAACALCLSAGSPTTSHAGVIPWLYNAIFGPVGSLHGSYHGPGAYGPAMPAYSAGFAPAMAAPCSTCGPVQSYYQPYAPASYAPTSYAYAGSVGCAPCGNPCAYGDCPGGNCNIDYPSGAPVGPIPSGSAPASGTPRTYADEEVPGNPPTSPPDGFRPRSDGSEPPMNPMNDAFGAEALRPDNSIDTVIPRSQAAPADDAPPEEGPQAVGPSVPPLNLDETYTRGSAATRTRLAIRSNFRSASIARAEVDGNRDWIAVPKGTQLARSR